jgi:glycosyltransferase involved in cell wall biosynthesis
MLVAAIRLARRHRYDLVHAVEESAFIAMALRSRFGIPFVYDMDSSIAQQMTERHPSLRSIRWMLEAAERKAVRSSVGVLTVCRSLEEVARTHAPGKLVGRVEDPSLLETTAEEDVPTELADAGSGGPIVMYVGNLEPYQGIDLLLAAFRLTLLSVPEARLVIVGGADADVRRYTAQAEAMGIGQNVSLLGPRPLARLGSYLRRADVLVSPRLTGVNTPMKIYSYLDSGRPLVATRMAAHLQVLDDRIAIMVRPEPADMARAISRLLQHPELCRQLAERAAARVREEFSRPALRRKVDEFYGAVEREVRVIPPAPPTQTVRAGR